MKNSIFVLLFLMQVGFIIAQDIHFPINSTKLKKEIVFLNKKIHKLIKKEDCLDNFDDFRIYHKIYFYYDTIYCKKDFIDKSFLSKLTPQYIEKRKALLIKVKYLRTDVYIGDSLGNLIARSNGNFIDAECNRLNRKFTKGEKEIYKLFALKQMDFMFHMDPSQLSLYFGINNDNIFLIRDNSDYLEKTELSEYIDCCWEEFLFYGISKKPKQ